jgi:hypothetical protein
VHAASPAELHLRSQSIEIDFILRVYRSKANWEDPGQSFRRRLRMDKVWDR